MKYAAIAALVATASAAEAAKKYKCAADPIEKVEGFTDATAGTCTTAYTTAGAEKTKVDGLAAAQNTAIKAFLDKCGALPNAIDTATHAKITCTADTMTTVYYSADTCADDKKVTLSPATKGWAALKTGCGQKDWNGLAISAASPGLALSDVKNIKITMKAGVEDKGDATTTDAKALGAAVAATTLAVAATLY